MIKNTIDIKIVQTPSKVTYKCQICDEEIEIPYKTFIDTQAHAYPGDWTTTKCDACRNELEINNIEYD